MLPRDHPDRIAGRLDAAIASVGAGRLDDAAATLSAVMEDEERWLYQVGRGCNTRQQSCFACAERAIQTT